MKRLVVVVLIALLAACGPSASPTPSPSPAGPSPSASTSAPTTAPSASPPISSPSGPASPALSGAIREVRSDLGRRTAADVGGPAAQAVTAADMAFALRLYGSLAKTSGNLIFSPYSVSTALSMTAAGARGTTYEQLARTLGIGADPVAWHGGRNDLDQALLRPSTIDPSEHVTPLRIEPTNALFGQDGFAFRPAYLDLLAADYGAGLQAVDFANHLEASRAAVNRWVADRTNDRIRELLTPGTVDEFTRFVLVNAIFFKASWASPFEPAATTMAPFHRLDGTAVKVPTMHGTVSADYARGDGWRAVEIPYVGATMTVIVPDAGRFAAVEQTLDAAFVDALADHWSLDLVHLAMPRWTSTTSVDLVGTLKTLGITDLFDPERADLGGIADAGLSVGRVIHKATIEVDEHGTEAAAATAVVGDTSGGGPLTEVTVTLDRPFIYLIRDGESGELLFVGRVLDPAAD